MECEEEVGRRKKGSGSGERERGRWRDGKEGEGTGLDRLDWCNSPRAWIAAQFSSHSLGSHPLVTSSCTPSIPFSCLSLSCSYFCLVFSCDRDHHPQSISSQLRVSPNCTGSPECRAKIRDRSINMVSSSQFIPHLSLCTRQFPTLEHRRLLPPEPSQHLNTRRPSTQLPPISADTIQYEDDQCPVPTGIPPVDRLRVLVAFYCTTTTER